jgi:hypothetical protein
MKSTQPPISWEEGFDLTFVYTDQGPDADGYDAELPCWDDNFKHDTDFDQIEQIKNFIRSTLARKEEEVKQDVMKKATTVFNTVHCANCQKKAKKLLTNLAAMRKKI